MKKYHQFLLILLFILYGSCEKEYEVKERDYPAVLSEIKEVNEKGVMFSGKFLAKCSDIKEYGFIYREEGAENNHKISFEEYKDEFEYFLNSDIPKGKKYLMKAYAENENYVGYGNEVSFISKGFVPDDPIIKSFTPKDVTDGMHVSLEGGNFSCCEENIKIYSGEFIAELEYTDQNDIIFKIPPGMPPGNHKFTLQVYNKKVEFGPLTIHNPVVQDYFPKEGFDGTEVTIIGDYFADNIKVYFGSNEAKILELSKKKLKVRSPDMAESGEVEVYLNLSGRKIPVGNFNVKTFVYSGISSNTGRIGDEITIYGDGFIQEDRKTEIYFDNYTAANIISLTNNEISFIVPIIHEKNSQIIIKNGLKELQIEFIKKTSWKRLSDFPGTPRSYAAGAVLNSKAFIGLGYNNKVEPSYLKDWWSYDPSGDHWTRLSDFPAEAPVASTAFSYNGKVYLGCSYHELENNHFDLWEYSPESDTWTLNSVYDVGPVNLDYPESIIKDGNAYFITNGGHFSYNLYSGEWKKRANQPVLSNRFCSLINNRIYWFFNNESQEMKVYEYISSSNSWNYLTTHNSLGVNYHETSFTINDKVYFGGGRTQNSPFMLSEGFMFEFNPLTMELIRREPYINTIANQVAFVIDNIGYTGLGITIASVYYPPSSFPRLESVYSNEFRQFIP